MAKKIAASRPTRAGSFNEAPRKAARKAPAAKKAPAKKAAVKVAKKAVAKKKLPQTLDWGKRVPKDHLSYLSKEEMKVLQKNRSFKGKRSFKGVPAFPDPGDTGYGDKGQGTKSSTGTTSKSGNTSGVGGGGGGGGGSTGSRGSSSGSVGAGNGANAGAGQGGQRGSYNSGTSGSRYGGASTQGPGMGRNEGQVGPRSPMSGQGTSFRTPAEARAFQRSQLGIEDQTGRMGPYKGPLSNGLMSDPTYGPFNPNRPYTSDDQERYRKFNNDLRDNNARAQARAETDFYRNPQEIRESARSIQESLDRMNQLSEGASYPSTNPLSSERFRTNVSRASASDRLPDVKLGGPRSGTKGGYSGGGMGGTHQGGGGFGRGDYKSGQGAGGWKAGGLIKKSQPRKTFKKK